MPGEREEGPEPPPLLESGGGGGGAEFPLVRLSPLIGRLRCSEEEKNSDLWSVSLENIKLTLLLDGVQWVDEAGRDKSFRSIWSLHPEPFRVILEKMSQIFLARCFNEFNIELLSRLDS